MKSKAVLLLSLLLCFGLAAQAAEAPAKTAKPAAKSSKPAKPAKQDKKKDTKKKGGDEGAPDPQKAEKDLAKLMRDVQFDLEGGSSRSFLSKINQAKFDDYPRFEDNVERLMRENALRVNFRTAFTAPPSTSGQAQVSADAIMELTRKDSKGAPQRRSQQMVFDWEWTQRGWKIINITPRMFFNP